MTINKQKKNLNKSMLSSIVAGQKRNPNFQCTVSLTKVLSQKCYQKGGLLRTAFSSELLGETIYMYNLI